MKLILTRELGRLVKWLRILGLDAEYFTGDKISSLIIQALREERIILTRNHRVPKSRGIKVIIIQSEKINQQVAEAVKGLGIQPVSDKMFTRCAICNAELIRTDKNKVKERIPKYVFETQENFAACPKCSRIYWRGTHWEEVKKSLEQCNL